MPRFASVRGVLKMVASALVLATAVGCTGGTSPGRPADTAAPRPRTMAALGDSITRGFAACGGGVGDCVQMSWTTGTAEGLGSHAQRLAIDNPERKHNLAVSGAQVSGLRSQADAAVQLEPDYVTVLIGANDACTGDEESMTPVEQYTGAFNSAMETLARGLPDARILVLSVPDLGRLLEIGKDRPDVRRVWQSYGICQSILANPTDQSAAAEARRHRVRARIRAYNAAMAAACNRHAPQCRHDGGAVFGYRFNLDEISDLDYWHPSNRGQASLAEIAWEAGFWSEEN